MKIAVISYADPYYRSILKPLEQTKIQYCERHGYDYIFEEISVDNEHKNSWDKIPILKKYLDRYDIIFMTDHDSFIFNPDIKLEDLPKADIIGAKLPHQDFYMIGCAVWFNTPGAHEILNALNEADFTDAYRAEEEAYNALDLKKFQILVDIRVNNVYNIHHEKDPLLLHYAGVSNPYIMKRLYHETTSPKVRAQSPVDCLAK